MKYASCAVITVACVFLVGCQTPYVYPKAPAIQSRADVVNDWGTLADRMIAYAPTGDKHYATYTYFRNVVPAGQPIYIDLRGDPSSFARAFRQKLENRLMECGYVVATHPEGARILRFETQWFDYRKHSLDHYYEHPTAWAAGAGVAVGVRGISSVDTALAVGGAAGPVLDLLNALDAKTHAQVMVTLFLRDADHLIFMRSETIYVPLRDLWRYGDSWGGQQNLQPQALRSVSLSLSGDENNGWGK